MQDLNWEKDAQKGHPSCSYQDLEMFASKGESEDAEGEMKPFIKSVEQSSCGAAEQEQKAGSPSEGGRAEPGMANHINTVPKHSQASIWMLQLQKYCP